MENNCELKKRNGFFFTSVSSMWTFSYEQAMRLWIRQIVALSYLYMRAAAWMRYVLFGTTVFGVFGTLYTIPGYGCSLVTGEACDALQWTGISIGILTGTSSMVVAIYDPAVRKMAYEKASKELLQISRTIDNELSNEDAATRMDPGELRKNVVAAYDRVLDQTPLPWFIRGEQQLANMSLLQSYTAGAKTNENPAVEGEEKVREIQMTRADFAVVEQIRQEMNRLERFVDV